MLGCAAPVRACCRTYAYMCYHMVRNDFLSISSARGGYQYLFVVPIETPGANNSNIHKGACFI